MIVEIETKYNKDEVLWMKVARTYIQVVIRDVVYVSKNLMHNEQETIYALTKLEDKDKPIDGLNWFEYGFRAYEHQLMRNKPE